MYNDRFVSSVLLCSYDLVDEVDHPRPCAWSSTLRPGGEVKLLHNSVLVVSRLHIKIKQHACKVPYYMYTYMTLSNF